MKNKRLEEWLEQCKGVDQMRKHLKNRLIKEEVHCKKIIINPSDYKSTEQLELLKNLFSVISDLYDEGVIYLKKEKVDSDNDKLVICSHSHIQKNSQEIFHYNFFVVKNNKFQFLEYETEYYPTNITKLTNEINKELN